MQVNSTHRIIGYSGILLLLNALKLGFSALIFLALKPEELVLSGVDPVAWVAFCVPFLASLVADVKVIIVKNHQDNTRIRLGAAPMQWAISYTKYFMLVLFPIMLIGAVYDFTQGTFGYALFEEHVVWPVLLNVLSQTLFFALVVLPIMVIKQDPNQPKSIS